MSHPGHNVPLTLWRTSGDWPHRLLIPAELSGNLLPMNEAFATRMASAMAEGLGVSIRGVVEGTGTLGGKRAEAFGQAAKGIGGAIGGLFGGQKTK